MKPVVNPNSIQFKLTAGMILASVVGIGSFTGWINWRMGQLFVKNHKDNALVIAQRLEEDVALFDDEGMAEPMALSKAIDYREEPDVAIWVVAPDGSALAESDTLTMGSWQTDGFAEALVPKVQGSGLGLDVVNFMGRSLVTCSSPLRIAGETVGTLYVVDDISKDQDSLSRITRTLALSSILAIALGAIATSLYVNRALRPIRKLNRLAGNVSAENLADTQLELENAPAEVEQLAETYNMMISRLADAWDQQKRFVSDVSHELRTPLTLVHGYLQSALRRGHNLTAPQREGLEIAADEADRTIHLLQELLDLARADGGHMRFNIEPEPLHEVVQEVLEMCHYSSDRIASELEPVTACADRSRLKQVMINLVDNAVKYSEADTVVAVSLKKLGDRAYIEVKDRGRGIPLSDLTKIFEPFYRVDEDRCRATGGTGLGLSIVKTLVEGMNGTLKVQSKLGEGSIFTVSLPA
ncbi:MAG: sensor histidine kinase [Phormidesmis sp.]